MASTLFTGASRYSQDFSAVVERQVGIASLALTQMQRARQTSNDQISGLRWLSEKVAGLQSTLQAVEESVKSKALQTTSSDLSAVRATAADGVATGKYTVQVTALGAYSTSVSKTAGRPVISDPSSGDFVTAGTTQLTMRITDHSTGTPSSVDTTIDLAGGTSLQSVVNAINSKTGLNVSAAIVNLGTTDSPNYALSLQGTKLGKFALQLKEGATDLMNVNEADPLDPSLGSRAEYKINGATVQSDSRTVTLAPKLTAELLKADAGKEVTVNITRGTTAFQTAINNFITAYNTVIDEADKLGGKNGSLAGNSLVATVRQQLRNLINNSSASGTLNSMAKAGIEFTSTGKLSLNSVILAAETQNNFDGLAALIGTAGQSGFMKVATDSLNALTGASQGVLTSSINSLDKSLKAEDTRIEAEQQRVERFTQDLQERLAKADALIAQMEQQANYFNNMFESMRVNQRSMS